jgi:hypothetical protein
MGAQWCALKRRVNMRHKLFAVGCAVAIAVTAAAGIAAAPASASPNPHNNSCQATEAGGGGTPGNAATSPGSVFNEPTINSPLGGKGGQAYNTAQASNKVGAAAQYDTACVNTTNNGTATPMQPAPAATQIPNNSVATRAANGVISHTGNGGA